MEKQDLIKAAEHFVEISEANYITRETAVSKNAVGLKMYDAPIFAFGAADDECYKKLKQPSAIGEHFLLPNEWLPQAKTVISFFLPFSEAVREGNKKDMSWPSEEWLYGRVEGQVFINKLCAHLQSKLIKAGYGSLVPVLDERFWFKTGVSSTSNWSERHAGFICGLGTFGLSKGLITQKGMAGRMGSILTELSLEPDRREYEELYEYCSMCGKCVKNCPVKAISLKKGKDHSICSKLIDKTAEMYKPRYGCGKCQVAVPCEYKIPV